MTHYSILSPSKKLSQLIAQSWLNGDTRFPPHDQPLEEFLIENDILSEQEATFFENIIVDESDIRLGEPPYASSINALTKSFGLRYPERPDGITDEALEEWISSPFDSPPWIPDDERLRFIIPIIHIFIGED